MSAVRALLGGIVDYAGLFPPTALAMPEAVANYAAYATSPEAWMLGRFVVPVARLDEFAAASSAVRAATPAPDATTTAAPWRVTALLGDNVVVDDVARVRTFNDAYGVWARVDTLEGHAASTADVDRLAAAALPAFDLYIEIQVVNDPSQLIAAIGRRGAKAKIRTGGITPAAIPTAAQLGGFIHACAAASVPFKATAGLHHPIRGEYALAYASDAPRAVTWGYLNVFLAAALLRAGGTVDEVCALLSETDARAIEVNGDTVRWRAFTFTAADLSAMRSGATSFGSCSFREPVDDLASLGLA